MRTTKAAKGAAPPTGRAVAPPELASSSLPAGGARLGARAMSTCLCSAERPCQPSISASDASALGTGQHAGWYHCVMRRPPLSKDLPIRSESFSMDRRHFLHALLLLFASSAELRVAASAAPSSAIERCSLLLLLLLR